MAAREVEEECGLKFKPKELFGIYEMEIEDRKVISHLFLGDFSGDIQFDKEEVEDCRWCSYEEAKKLELSFFYDRVIEDLRLKGII